MNTIRNRLESTQRTRAMTLNMAHQSTRSLPGRRGLDDRAVLQREVAGRDLAGMVRQELWLVLAALGELRVRAAGVEPAARGRVDRARDVALEDDALLGGGQIRVRDGDRREQGPRIRVFGVAVKRLPHGHLDD